MFVLGLVLAVRQGLGDLVNLQINPAQVIVLRSGVPSETMSQLSRDEQERVRSNVRQINNNEAISAEAVIPVDVHERGSAQAATIFLRGLQEQSSRRRSNGLAQGRWFASGSNEIVVGARALRQFSEFSLGSKVSWGRQQWTVVGIVDGHGSMSDGEAWADLDVVQSSYARGASVQSIYFDYPANLDLDELKKIVNQGQESELDVQRTHHFLAGQVEFLRSYIQAGMIALGSYLILCVLLGTASIMDSILEPRMKQYSIINAIGYPRAAILFVIALEGACIGLAGGVLGMTMAYAVFDAVQVSTSTGASQIEFALNTTWSGSLGLLILSVTFGALGAWLAAIGLARRSANINAIIS
jgi:putative ABC transport system permease protein